MALKMLDCIILLPFCMSLLPIKNMFTANAVVNKDIYIHTLKEATPHNYPVTL